MRKRKRLADDRGRSTVLKAMTKGSKLMKIEAYDPYQPRTLDPKKMQRSKAQGATDS